MISNPRMIEQAARDAGMKVPPDVTEDYDKEEYPHWAVYCTLQLGVPVRWGNHWKNARIIAQVPEEKIKTMTVRDFEDLGFDP